MNRDERLERTMSMAQNKGLLNNPGENNCFLNSAVQVFWHLDVFRRSFREIKGHFCMGKSCIFCALQYIFKEFQYSSNDALPPDTLRVAMASTFRDQRKFQMGDMDDAAECFENILSRMHFHLAMNEHDDGCNAKHCISHQKFAMQLIEQTICPCGERSEPLPFFQLVHYVSASALCTHARMIEKQMGEEYDPSKHFGTLLRKTGEDRRECPSPECDERIRVQRLLLNCPDIVSIGLIWDSESPDVDHIGDVLDCIGTTLRLQYLFHQVYDDDASKAKLHLVGIVTYYGKHYSTFFFHSKLKTWIYFDDARVREIGQDWSVIRDKCRRCHYQPLLLLYANQNGQPINTETAPKERILVNGATFARGGDGRTPIFRRLSSEGPSHRHETERPRVRRPRSRAESPDRTLREIDSDSNMSTLTSHSNPATNGYGHQDGSDDTLKAHDSSVSHSKWYVKSDDSDDTLKARDSARQGYRDDLISFKRDKPRTVSTRRSKSCDALDESSPRVTKKTALHRTGSTGSDVTDKAKRRRQRHTGSAKEKPRKSGLKRIGSAIMQVMKPAVVVSGVKSQKPKRKILSKDRRPSDTSMESNGEQDLMDLSPNPESTTKAEIMKLYEQTKSDDYLRSPSHDSGIGSATGSVSSTDTNHGGSQENLIDFSQTLHSMRNGGLNRDGRNVMSRNRELCEILLRDAENMMTQSQNAENSRDLPSAIKYCTEASISFSKASELLGASHNNIMYANMKKALCQDRSKALRRKIDRQSSERRVPRREEDDLLVQQRIRDEMILKQQQQNLPQYDILPRNLPIRHEIYTPNSTIQASQIPEERTVGSEIHYHSPEYYPASDSTVSSLHTKPKRTSSYHYVKRTTPMSTANVRNREPVCTQKIKPDSLCYSPMHYNHDDISSRIQGLSIQPQPMPHYSPPQVEKRRSYEIPRTPPSSPGNSRGAVNESGRSKPRPQERKVSSTATIFLSTPKVATPTRSYDPTVYASEEREPRRQSKVFYAGTADNSQSKQEQGIGSRSYDSIDTCVSSSSSSSGRAPGNIPYNQRPPNYRPSPPSYQIVQQSREALRSNSATSFHKPWYQESSSSLYGHTGSRSEPDPSNLHEISARIIADKPVCVRCQRIQVDRHQRMCAGCEEELRRKHAPDYTAIYY